jgi:hypothetical protein
LNDKELMNVSINMSIIKHNEFKCMSSKDGNKEIGTEEGRASVPDMGQDYQN